MPPLTILCLLVIIRLKSECRTSQKRIGLNSCSFPLQESQVKRWVSVWLQINYINVDSEYNLLSLKDLSWTAYLIFCAHDSEAFNFAANFQEIFFNFFFFRMTSYDVGLAFCSLFYCSKSVNPTSEKSYGKILPPPTPLFNWAGITATLLHCYIQVSLSAQLHSYSFSKFLFCVSTIASLSKYQQIPYIVFCWVVSNGFFGCKCAPPRGSLGIMYHAECTMSIHHIFHCITYHYLMIP